MKNISYIILLILVCSTLICCSYFSRSFTLGQKYPSTSPAQISVVEGTPDKTFEVVGKVHSHCRKNWFFGWGGGRNNKMMEMLKKEAALLGANAIMDVKTTRFSQFEWSDIHYHATAIRWK